MENPRGPDIDRVRETIRERDEQVSGSDQPDEPDVAELDEDPAYNPDDPGLKDIKGG